MQFIFEKRPITNNIGFYQIHKKLLPAKVS